MIKPKGLRPGSRIAVISPSSAGPSRFPGIYELGLRNMEELFGFEVVEMKTARMSNEELYGNPRLRAEDINEAFRDDRIDGIICSIGGYESVRILPYLDVEAILENPKLIMGFSDATSFLTYLNVKGLVTFYGPSVMAGFAQLKHAEPGYAGHIRDILYGDKLPYRYPRYEKWANGYKDWRNHELLGQFTELQEDGDGLVILQGRGEVEGTLWGGCIEVLEFLKGTRFWPGEDFWKDKILFFETSEEKPLPQNVGYMLRNYGMQGIFDKVKAVMFGRPRDYSEEEKKELYSIVSSIVKEEFNAPDLPIIMNAEYGHTDPKIVLPIGGRLKINLDEKYLELLESPFE